MHILISTRAKFVQLYQCTPLIVGDKYADTETMKFLGAKLTKDFTGPNGPPVYVLLATPMAVMDALQERGFQLKLSHTVDEYISWLMIKPSEQTEDLEFTDVQRHHADPQRCPTCPQYQTDPQLCPIGPQQHQACPQHYQANPPEEPKDLITEPEEKKTISPATVHVGVQTEKLEAYDGQLQPKKSIISITEEPKTEKIPQRTRKTTPPPSSSDSDDVGVPEKMVVTKSSDTSTRNDRNQKVKKAKNDQKRSESPRSPKKQRSTVTSEPSSQTSLKLASEHSDIKSTKKQSPNSGAKEDSDKNLPSASKKLEPEPKTSGKRKSKESEKSAKEKDKADSQTKQTSLKKRQS